VADSVTPILTWADAVAAAHTRPAASRASIHRFIFIYVVSKRCSKNPRVALAALVLKQFNNLTIPLCRAYARFPARHRRAQQNGHSTATMRDGDVVEMKQAKNRSGEAAAMHAQRRRQRARCGAVARGEQRPQSAAHATVNEASDLASTAPTCALSVLPAATDVAPPGGARKPQEARAALLPNGRPRPYAIPRSNVLRVSSNRTPCSALRS
jgi:hypothetical protein